MLVAEAYRKMKAHFSKPGARFGYDTAEELCRYRTPEGDKCAVGCLIPDTKYQPEFEDEELHDLLRDGLGFLLPADPVMKAEVENFLTHAQRLHDHYASEKTFVAEGLPLWDEDLSGPQRAVVGGIPEFLKDLDEMARVEFNLAVA